MIVTFVYLLGAALTSCVFIPRVDVKIARGDYNDVLNETERATWRQSSSAWPLIILGAIWPLLAVLFLFSYVLRALDGHGDR